MHPPLPPQVEFLERVLARSHPSAHDRPPVVVFDLDGTLLDNRARTLQILRAYADEVRGVFPDIAEGLGSLQRDDVAYMLADTLHGCGITRVDALQAISHFWREHFFAASSLVHDETVPGAVSFVRACHQSGATVVYFTGRDVSRLLGPTLDGLRDRGFPVGVAGVECVFNPDATLPDEAFKRIAVTSLARVGHIVAFFDNEPANCNVALRHYPNALVGWVQTQHVPASPDLEEGIAAITDFRRS